MSLPSVQLPELQDLTPEQRLEKAIQLDLAVGVAAITAQVERMLAEGRDSMVIDYPKGKVKRQVIRILFGDALREAVERMLSNAFGRRIFLAGINCHAVKTAVSEEAVRVSAAEQNSWQNGVNGAPDC